MVRSNFKADRLVKFVSEWEKLACDPKILNIVKHYHIQFKNGIYPAKEIQFFSLNVT